MKPFDLMAYLEVPRETPKGYVSLPEEPTFDPSRDLQLTKPTRSWLLSELGYTENEIRDTGCPLAFTEPFRLLSEEGAARLQEVVRMLRSYSQGGDLERSESKSRLIYVAGGVYRSRFLRELCSSIDVAEFLSELAGIPLAPHSMPSQQVYINYPPAQISEDIDRWHADSIGFDYVMLATDPNSFDGGEFEVFLGTTTEAAQLLGVKESKLNLRSTEELPSERVVRFEFPGAGYAVFQQGNRVVHRGRRLSKPGERITVVPGYVSRDPYTVDITDLANISTYTEPGIGSEIIRHGAWRSVRKLVELLDPGASQDLSRQRIELANALSDALNVLDITKSMSNQSLSDKNA
tara:strand:+ start:826 stop:1872 length:1047 start_codon:yes stop_codon:yes gene_type:complete